MKTELKKPVFKWAWEKLDVEDYTNIKDFNKAMKEYKKLTK